MVSIPMRDLQEGKRVRATDTLRDDVASMQARRMPVPVPAGPMGSPQAGPPVPTGGPPVPPTGGPPMGGSKSILYNKLQGRGIT